MQKIIDAVIIGILLFIMFSVPALDLYCFIMLDEPYGFIGCAVP